MSQMSVTGTASVYVGDLADAVTEQNLHRIFCRAGHIQSVRLCKETLTGESKGYGYVNYSSPTEAQRAVELLNHVVICGQPVRVMPSQRDASTRRSGIGNVFVKNLDQDLVTNRMLHDHFSQFGKILSAKVALDSDRRSRGYGFVQFAEPESAVRAILELDSTDFCGQTLSVADFIPAKDRAAEPGTFFNVYVKNIGSVMDEEGLRLAFARFGPISSTVVMRNSRGRSRGFGFVNFKNSEDAAKAVDEMDGQLHEGLHWKVNGARRRDQDSAKDKARPRLDCTHLCIKNLHANCTEPELRESFEVFGAIQSIRLVRGADGLGTGVAFIQFKSAEDAEAAITGRNKQTVGLHNDRVSVTLAPQRPQQGDQAKGVPYGGQSVADPNSSLPYQMHSVQPVLGHPSIAYYPGPDVYYGHPYLQAGQGQLPPAYVQQQAPASSHGLHAYDRGGLVATPNAGPFLNQANPGQLAGLPPVMRIGNSIVPYMGYESPPQYWHDPSADPFIGATVHAQPRNLAYQQSAIQATSRRALRQQPTPSLQNMGNMPQASMSSWLRPSTPFSTISQQRSMTAGLQTLGLDPSQTLEQMQQPSQLDPPALPDVQFQDSLMQRSALTGGRPSNGGEVGHQDLTTGFFTPEVTVQMLRDGSMQGLPSSSASGPY